MDTDEVREATEDVLMEQLADFAEFMEQFDGLPAVGETPFEIAKRLLSDPAIAEVLETSRAAYAGEIPLPAVIVLRPDPWIEHIDWHGSRDELEDAMQIAIDRATRAASGVAETVAPAQRIPPPSEDTRLRMLTVPVENVAAEDLELIARGLREGSPAAQALAEVVERLVLIKAAEAG